jgi:putative oxidoreductase
MKNYNYILYWAARLVAAGLMAQTLFYKFSGSAESIYIFETVGMEPWGRIGVGILELIASILLLLNRSAWLGAVIAAGLMVGALGMHVIFLGIEVMNDSGQLFIYALTVLLASIYIMVVDRQKLRLAVNRIIR